MTEDVIKYTTVEEQIEKLKSQNLIINDEERKFFMMLGNYLLQQKQKKIIEGKLF